MNIVLIGFRGSGKSTVGRQLAHRLGWPFVDTDALIEQRTGMTIREIYADQAEAGFREVESQIIAEVSADDGRVISTGGGAVLDSASLAALKRSGMLVYLAAPPEVLWHRIFNDAHRHHTRLKIDASTGLEEVRQALKDREPIYLNAADRIVDVSRRSVDSTVERIITRLGLRQRLRVSNGPAPPAQP